jgi:ADP-heptose:LPS heptosyltransferase
MFKGKICISRIDKIGDMILTLPVIKSVKIQNPTIEIHILASAYNAKVLKGIKYVDRVLSIGSNTRSFIKEIRELRKIKYDFFINFSPNIKSFVLCFFSKSQKKATLVLLSRYKNNFFSKIFLRIFIKIFCHFQYVVNRFERLSNNQELHQTKMMFRLIEECNIKHSQDVSVDIDLPLEKLIFYQEKTIAIHLSDKWINSFYSENNLLELISSLNNKDCKVILTTDHSTQYKFKKIYDYYKIISGIEFRDLTDGIDNNGSNKQSIQLINEAFTNSKSMQKNTIILDNLDYDLWVRVIYSSSAVITPECGCSHIAAACKTPVNIIYDPSNHPEAIHKEYAPWKSKYNKFVFDEKNLNKSLIKHL